MNKIIIALLFLGKSTILVSYLASYHNLDSQVSNFLEQLAAKGGPPLNELPIEDARKVLDDLQKPTINQIPAKIKDTEIMGSNKEKISIRIVRPQGKSGKLPVVVYAHGGGWILGNKDTHDYLIRSIANGAQVAVAFVNYTPSPEAKYPVAIEQIYDVASYIAREGKELDLDGSKMVIAGDSVGGNMATVVAQMAKDRRGPRFLYQILLYPVTDANFNTGSYKEFGDGRFWLSKPAMEWFWDAYLPDKKRRSEPYASPLRSSEEQLRGLPPALIIVDENDVLRDEGENYARKLMQAGVQVTPVRMLAVVHDFAMLAPLKDNPITRAAIDLVNQTLIKVFKR